MFTKKVSRQIDMLHNGRHVTNFSNKQLDLYGWAIKEFNRVYPHRSQELHIDNNAFSMSGILLSEHSALVWIGEHFDLTDFWEIFDRLKAKGGAL